ncbi:FAD-dependent monooxygenase [Sphingomonas sp. RT2P30]|uniref:NAD(P)/FAD-dependent oxidoreductase n=1 Tax=Parasphingomonas halimpatiens TaxID=3096162 RepID=UPI002FCA0A4A
MRRTPALIVGGGPAGLATALLLARAGAPHLLIERQAETGDALCGGFLSWRTLAMLERLGVRAGALNRDHIRRVSLHSGARHAIAPLPRPALAVSRWRLDTILAEHARTAGAAIETGVTARRHEQGAIHLADGATLTADTLFLASGKHDLRGLARPAEARGDDPVLGLRVRLGRAPALDRMVGGTIELHLFDRGYAGIAAQEDGTVNLCMAVHRSRLEDAGSPAALLTQLGNESPQLGERLAFLAGGATIDAVANVPYGWRETAGTPGLFRLGDQAAVIPSLAGEGIGIALESGARAAAAYCRGGRDAAIGYQAGFADATRRPIGVAGMIWHGSEKPALAAALTVLARLAPSLVGLAARLTRVKHSPLDVTLAGRES